MLDENLPTFFLNASSDKIKHHESFFFTQNGSEPEAQYALHHVDPASLDAKNTYAVALFDAHHPEILYAEVLSKPGWTHPTLSQEEIRKNGGVPPPPQPIYPTEIAVQLYNPDLQVLIKHQTSKWSSTLSWEFSLPQVTFRMPSSSNLDRTLTDPAANAATPRVNFVWRKEGRMGKDMTCYMTGKSTDMASKKAKKSKEPDIAVALFSGLKELTIMEPNLYRIDIEDYKGLEVVLLLGAAVIRDLFFSDPLEQFHINSTNLRKNSGGLRARKGSSPLEGGSITPPVLTPEPPPPPAYTGPSQYPPEKVPLHPASSAAVNARIAPPVYSNRMAAKRLSLPPLATSQGRPVQVPPPTQRPGQQRPGPRRDARAQWEIDAETARLRKQVEVEARDVRRRDELDQKARRKQGQAEERKTMEFLEQERKQKQRAEQEQRRKQAEIDKETERLRKQYGYQAHLQRPRPQAQRHSVPLLQQPWQRPPWHPAPRPAPVPAPAPRIQLQAPVVAQAQPVAKAKKSFWGLRSRGESQGEKIKKKKSSLF